MQMFPWEKQILKCELDFDNIQIYDVPKNIDLEINGWGSGKFTNNQYFEKNSFSLNTNGNQYSDFLNKIFGTYSYDFQIHVKKDNWGYEFGYTHLFSIPKKKQSKQRSVSRPAAHHALGLPSFPPSLPPSFLPWPSFLP